VPELLTIGHPDTKQVQRFPPTGDAAKLAGWKYNTRKRMWTRREFPSLKPTSRREVVLLREWLDTMLENLDIDASTSVMDIVQQAQAVHSACFHELVRQVTVQCAERGELMVRVWRTYLDLFTRMVEIHNQNEEQLKQQHRDLEHQHEEHVASIGEERKVREVDA